MAGQNKRNLFSLLWNWKWLIGVYSLSTGDDDQSSVNQRLIESESFNVDIKNGRG